MAYAKPRMLAPHAWSATDLLLEAGMDRPLATIGVSGIFWTPAESDPASPVTEIITFGVQNMLKKAGFSVKAHGIMDSATQNALAQIGGRSWASQPWFSLYDAIRMRAWKSMEPLGHPDGEALGLGATGEEYLSHARLSATGSTGVKFADLRTVESATQYAAAGFHSSVTQGLASTGARRSAWNTAAGLYLKAWDGGKLGYSIESMRTALTAANQAASAAATKPVVRLPTTIVDMSEGAKLATEAVGVGTLGIVAMGLGALLLFGGGKKPRARKKRRR